MVEGKSNLMFGTGDINVVTGYKKDTKNGLLLLRNQEAREVTPGVMNGDTPSWNTDDYDVVMEFEKVTSVDVVIQALQEIRDLMTKKYARCVNCGRGSDFCNEKYEVINNEDCNGCDSYYEADEA